MKLIKPREELKSNFCLPDESGLNIDLEYLSGFIKNFNQIVRPMEKRMRYAIDLLPFEEGEPKPKDGEMEEIYYDSYAAIAHHICPRSMFPPHRHDVEKEVVTVLEGCMEVYLYEDMEQPTMLEVKPGGVILIPAGVLHYARFPGKIRFIAQTSPGSDEWPHDSKR